MLKGWKYAGFIAGVVGFIGLAIYPIVIAPMLNTDKYSKNANRVVNESTYFNFLLQKKSKNVLGRVLIKKKFNLEVRNRILFYLS